MTIGRQPKHARELPLTRRQYGNLIAEWAARKPWDHFVTLTLKYRTSAQSAAAYFHGSFIERLRELTGPDVAFYGQVEAGPLHQRIHIHVLLFGTKDLVPGAIQRAWGAGISEIEPYDRRKRGAGYVSDEWYQPETIILLDDHRRRRRHRRHRNPGRLARSLRRAVADHLRRRGALPIVADFGAVPDATHD